jgi:uncharacterized coiled-coil protein SlyX
MPPLNRRIAELEERIADLERRLEERGEVYSSGRYDEIKSA